jgi:uncharacterized membrane protein
MQDWILVIAFWLHMLATVVWIGYLATTSLWIIPTLQESLSADEFSKWIRKSNKRLSLISWISISILMVSGLIQMSANNNYDGLFLLTNNWAIALALKHVIFFGMIILAGYLSWKLHPELERIALLKVSGKASPHEGKIIARLKLAIRVSLVLGVATLALTAFARIS